MTRKTKKGLAMVVGLGAGGVLLLIAMGFRADAGTGFPRHALDWVTFVAPLSTFAVAVAACFEQASLHFDEVGSVTNFHARRGAIFIMAVATAFIVLVVCMALVRLDLAASKARNDRRPPQEQTGGSAPNGFTESPSQGFPPNNDKADDTSVAIPGALSQAASLYYQRLNGTNELRIAWAARTASLDYQHGTGTNELRAVLGHTVRHLFSYTKEPYDPCIHVTEVLLLFAWFLFWDFLMFQCGWIPEEKRDIKSVSFSLNIPTLCGFVVMLLVSVFGLNEVSVAEKEAFIAGIIAFHLAFAAIAFVLGVIIPTDNTHATTATVAPSVTPPAGQGTGGAAPLLK